MSGISNYPERPNVFFLTHGKILRFTATNNAALQHDDLQVVSEMFFISVTCI